MQVKSIYIGAALSLSGFVGVVIVSQVADDFVSRYPVLTDGYLGIAALSMLGCGYFLPRAVRAILRSRQ
jgi:hypothetical protein